jgi:hypothetical protein
MLAVECGMNYFPVLVPAFGQAAELPLKEITGVAIATP